MSELESSPHQRLRTARIAKGYANAKKFAQKYQIPYTTYIAHESGKISLSAKAAQNYARILNVPEDWILTGRAEGMAAENLTTSIYLKRKTFERSILPKVVESILTALNKKDETLDIEALIHKAYIITSELLAKAETLDDIDMYIHSIVVLSEKNLRKAIIVDQK